MEKLVKELCLLSAETQWLEFKYNNFEPSMIGRDISALANGAALCQKDWGYMVWGVNDSTHEIVGTEYDLKTLKKGNQELENWLRSLLSDNAEFEYDSVEIDGKKVGIMTIGRALARPVSFEKIEYIRIGSYTKKLSESPSVQYQLWECIRDMKFEEHAAKKDVELAEVIRCIDYSKYFDLTGIPQPSSAEGIVHYLTEEGFIIRQDNGLYAITNVGAVLLSKHLSEFNRLSRKAVRVVQYSGNNRLNMIREETIEPGYVLGFESIIQYIGALVPVREEINGVYREKKTAYPMLAIREAVANALIHQDFSMTGTGPVIELFDNRLEITNAGIPLVDVKRIIDNPPRSRNEKLAELMRRLRMCEELGTGWDKIVLSCEMSKLPAPRIDVYEESTKVTLYSQLNFSEIAFEDKIWACYIHACIKHVQGEQLTNSSLRERFGLADSSSAGISRLIKETVRLGLIKPLDPTTAPRYMKYIPGWA